MARPIFENMKLGKYPRRTDNVSEESGSSDDKEIVADLLQWMHVDATGATPLNKDKKEKDIVEMVEAGIALGGLDKVAAVSTLQKSPMKDHIQTGLKGLLYDIYYGARDLLSKKRVKTTLTILAGIGVGVAIGAILGTLVFPGIGSAIGGTIGGLITGAVAAVGGAVGLSIIGGVVGSWVGNRIAKKAFKDERHYEVSKRLTSKIKKEYGISGKTVQMMNAYIYNRRMAMKSPLCQRYLKMLRKNAIKNADPIAIERLAFYFCNELKLLDLEIQADSDNFSLQEDKRAVQHILRQLKNAEGLSFATRKKVEATLLYKQEKSELPPARMEVTTRERSKSAPAAVATPITSTPKADKSVSQVKQSMAQVNQQFVNNLREAKQLGKLDIKAVDAEQHRPDSKNHSYYLYHISRPNKPDLPDILYREVKINANQYSAEVLVDKSKLDEENSEDVSEVLVAQAKAIYQSSGNRHLKVMADKDDVLAVRLMAAALKAEMIPELDESEYPLDTPQATDKRKVMLAQAYELAGIPEPAAPKARVGFRVEFEP